MLRSATVVKPQPLLRETSMPRSSMRRLICAAFVFGLCTATPVYAHHLKKASTTTMPVTTPSAKARALYEKGMQDYENLYLERCNDDWRAAVKEDPNLAVAWAWIAFNGGNPEEVNADRTKAKALAPNHTPGDQINVNWIVDGQRRDFTAR